MSWDIVIFNSREHIVSPEEIDNDKLEPTDFLAVFKDRFANIQVDGEHHSIKEDDFTIEYFDDGEPSSNIMLSLYGEKAIYPLIALSIKNGWQIFDTELDEMIDLNNPSKNGYSNFQQYLNRILDEEK